MAEIQVYKQWFFQHILPRTPDGRSDTILMLPCGSGKPKYRDVPNASVTPNPLLSDSESEY